jgi:alpha/beta superfamily hydrolase
MSDQANDGFQVEFYYVSPKGERILFAAGSHDDVAEAGAEAADIDADQDAQNTAAIGAGAEHFYRKLGQTGGVAPITEEVLTHYKGLVESSREAFRGRLRNPDKQ